MAYDKNKETCVILTVQQRLNELGYDAGAEDNEDGPNTRAAVSRFKTQHGLDPRPYLGPISISKLFSKGAEVYVPPEPPIIDIDPNDRTPWLTYAMRFEGLKEIPGAEDNPQIVQWGKDAGIDWWNNDDDAWCAVFVNGCLVNTGFKSTRSALARSFAANGIGDFPHGYGAQLAPNGPLPPGTIVVMPRGTPPSGHVAIVIEDYGSSILCINGNVSNMVKQSVYEKSKLLPSGARFPDNSTRA